MTHEAVIRPSSLPTVPAAIFAVLITLLSLVPARRGSRPALVAIVVTRVISAALFAAPALFLDAPVWVMVVVGFIIAGTIIALVLLWQQGRRIA